MKIQHGTNSSSENQSAAASTQDVRGSGLSVADGSGLRIVRRYESWPVSGPAMYNKGWQYYIQTFRPRFGFFGSLGWYDYRGPFNSLVFARELKP